MREIERPIDPPFRWIECSSCLESAIEPDWETIGDDVFCPSCAEHIVECVTCDARTGWPDQWEQVAPGQYQCCDCQEIAQGQRDLGGFAP